MNAFDAARRIGLLLEADGIEYAIGGALALGVWGVPRGTKDVDVAYVRGWLAKMPVGPDRTAILDDLVRLQP